MKKKPAPRIELNPREPATPGTIGVVFDYYRDLGHDKLPDRVTINSDKFNSQPKNK